MSFGIVLVSNAAIKTNKALYGKGRYQTAIEVSKSSRTSSTEVILVSGTAIPFAYLKDAPMLLTEKDSLNSDTKTELRRLGVQKVYIVGGEAVVSNNVKKQLESNSISVENKRRYKI